MRIKTWNLVNVLASNHVVLLFLFVKNYLWAPFVQIVPSLSWGALLSIFLNLRHVFSLEHFVQLYVLSVSRIDNAKDCVRVDFLLLVFNLLNQIIITGPSWNDNFFILSNFILIKVFVALLLNYLLSLVHQFFINVFHHSESFREFKVSSFVLFFNQS